MHVAYNSKPKWVSGPLGNLYIEPPITHPAHCVCNDCPSHRQRLAHKKGLTIEEANALEITIRAKRRAPFQRNRSLSSEAARRVKQEEETRLLQLLANARHAEAAAIEAAAAELRVIRFGAVVDNYRRYMIDGDKDYDHAKSRIDAIENFFGRTRDTETLTYSMYEELLAEVCQMHPETQRHYANTLLAMLNRAKAQRIIPSHHLEGVIVPTVVRDDEPTPWTRRELGIIMGPALRQYEREQADWNAKVAQEKKNRGLRSPSYIPLRGLCLIAYYTMIRPGCNRALCWHEVTLDPDTLTGWYKLDKHKNVNKGIKARGPLAKELVEYLLAIRPPNASGLIHPNPATGEAYSNIRKQWYRLMEIAGRMLGYELQARSADFFNFRHTGASDIARRGRTATHLLAVVKMMGDTSLATVNRHYFNIELEMMQELVLGWERPDFDFPASASTSIFGAEQTPICDMPLPSDLS